MVCLCSEKSICHSMVHKKKSSQTKTARPGRCDCSAESPKGRRSICYDSKGQEARKTCTPETNAVDMAAAMGITLLTETQYHMLQALGPFDTKTSSWLDTPSVIRQLGGALFADYRYSHVFIYHNGASSYYSSRGFRGSLSI